MGEFFNKLANSKSLSTVSGKDLFKVIRQYYSQEELISLYMSDYHNPYTNKSVKLYKTVSGDIVLKDFNGTFSGNCVSVAGFFYTINETGKLSNDEYNTVINLMYKDLFAVQNGTLLPTKLIDKNNNKKQIILGSISDKPEEEIGIIPTYRDWEWEANCDECVNVESLNIEDNNKEKTSKLKTVNTTISDEGDVKIDKVKLNRDYQYWYDRYKITIPILDKFLVKPAELVYIGTKQFYRKYTTDPCYVYAWEDNTDTNKNFKLYRPYATKEYKWRTNHSKVDDIGIGTYLDKSSTILTKSRKDRMILYLLGYDSYCLNNESTIPNELLYNAKFVLYDNDYKAKTNVGQLYGNQIANKFGITNLCIPSEYKCKDISDFVWKHGIDKVREWLNSIIVTGIEIDKQKEQVDKQEQIINTNE